MENTNKQDNPVIEEPQKEDLPTKKEEPQQTQTPEPNPYKKERERGKKQLVKELEFDNIEQLKETLEGFKQIAQDVEGIKKENQRLKEEKKRLQAIDGLKKEGFDENFANDALLILSNTPEELREAKKEELLTRFGTPKQQTNNNKSNLSVYNYNDYNNDDNGGDVNVLIDTLAKWREGKI